MAARALAIEHKGPHEIMSVADTRKILDAITASDRSTAASFSVLTSTVAGLQEKVSNIGVQVNSLTQEVQTMRDGKASRSELAASEARFERAIVESKSELSRDLARMEKNVDQDVQGFQGMYESVVSEMKEMRDLASKERGELGAKLDSLIASRDSQDARLKALEPLRDTWLKAMGARWVIGVLSGLLGAGGMAAVIRYFSGAK